MTALWDTLTTNIGKMRVALQPQDRRSWVAVAAVVALALFLSTVQTDINGSGHRYATDTDEIQNALPRWGLIHRSGYPLYTALGSLFVTVLRLFGIPPAAGASLFSTVWAVITIALVVILAQELGAPGPASALAGLATALSTAMWVDASLAEVHTMTLALSLATLIFAVRFGRDGEQRDLLLLSLCFSQGVTHQRSVVLLAPAVGLLILPHLQALWRDLVPAIGIALLGPLTYLYMPLRVWTGATWVFGSPGTWEGFWLMVFDNRAERVFDVRASSEEWLTRLNVTLDILSVDMLWPLLVLGLLGVVVWGVQRRRIRESLALTLAWLPNFFLTLLIWHGKVIDAQLAAKLPILPLAAIGLALGLDLLWHRSTVAKYMATGGLLLSLIVWGAKVRPFVLSITRDPGAQAVIAHAEQVAPPPDYQPTTLVVPWGHDYWAMAYAQSYQGRLPGLTIVDHNADFSAIVARGDRLLIQSKTLNIFPLSWWEARLGRLYLTSVAPGLIELNPERPLQISAVPPDVNFDLENGVKIRSADLAWPTAEQLLVTVYWEVVEPVAQDYSVAVHLVRRDPPVEEADVLDQADAAHPVGGWYPLSRWEVGEIVGDHYVLVVPEGRAPVAVRVGLYRTDPEQGFVNSPWLSLPLPAP